MAQCAVLSSAVAVTLLSLLGPVAAHYTPTWAVHIPGGKEAADAVARDHGFINLGEILEDHYHFQHAAIAKRSAEPARAHHGRLEADRRVRWARQQTALSRKKRDFRAYQLASTAESPSSSEPASAPAPSASPKRAAGAGGGGGARREMGTRVKGRPRSAETKFQLNDPKWPHMWYLNRGGGLDMNVVPAWREGVTGRGVVVTILDDGLETDHPDLAANYDPMASYDVNSHDSDPQPRYDMIDSNRHGTRCAGEVAATANNSLCAVGVAFGARVGGVRMLDGDVTDAVEARSLSLNPQHVDIYSASWGPDDDGKTVDGPGELATRAFIEGVTKGRGGKGSIFVWASGNGGRELDNCNCDGYTNSIWTLSISSATERGDVPWYSEKCSSTLAATYSSGAIADKQVVTTDLHHACTASHTGTSASAPLAAGICALALQANRDLSWRDMQHIVVRTARPERLGAGGEWRVNGAGRNVSHSFGYGLLDAAAMVRLARSWRPAPPQRRCELAAPARPTPVPPRSTVTLQLEVSACPGVNYLEHVQARVSVSAARRGDLRVALTSPAGTRVTLLTPRPHDSSRAGFSAWPFMSVHMWGEAPLGLWQLDITNEGRYMGRATLQDWSLMLYGTSTPAAKDDPKPFRRPAMAPAAAGRANSTRPAGAVLQAARKNGRGRPTPSATSYTVGLVKRKKNKNSKNPNKNSQKSKQLRPATRAPPATTPRAPEPAPAPRAGSVEARGRKMSNLFQQYPKIQRLYPAPLTAHAGGPQTQWELIFYGTETPPQEDDAPDSNALGGEGGAPSPAPAPVPAAPAPAPHSAEELQHNALDLDSAFLWHAHTISEDSPPEAMEADAGAGAAAGCVTAAPQSTLCIACARGLHLLGGRCVAHCPPGTFAAGGAAERSERHRNLTAAADGARRDAAAAPTALEALAMEPAAGADAALTCAPCHYSCATCAGPADRQCAMCPADARPVPAVGAPGTFCVPVRELAGAGAGSISRALDVVLGAALFAACSVLAYLGVSCARRAHCCGGGPRTDVAYNKLAADDAERSALDLQHEIQRALSERSDSDSEEDLSL